jgi:hypothetical protein
VGTKPSVKVEASIEPGAERRILKCDVLTGEDGYELKDVVSIHTMQGVVLINLHIDLKDPTKYREGNYSGKINSSDGGRCVGCLEVSIR